MTKKIPQALQIAALIIGTIVGAGFSTGQEIIQFFSRYGSTALYAIAISTLLFMWLSYKIMILAAKLDAKSYEDLNVLLFGKKMGKIISWFLFFILLGVCSVMLAGAGAVFEENWNIPSQIGLILTVIGTFFIVRKGLQAIFIVNSIIVPIMLIFTLVLVTDAIVAPEPALYISNMIQPLPLWRGLITPFVYVAFNLALAQAVLVPIGAKVKDKATIKLGAILAGVGIGILLFVAHFAISTHYDEIKGLAIPMGGIAKTIGETVYLIYVFIIYAEIFTTLVADIYGISLQSKQYIKLPTTLIYGFTLFICFLVAQLGFQTLISTLYQLFGYFSLAWLALLIFNKSSSLSSH